MPERGSPLFPEAPKRHRIHGGLRTERQEHIFTWSAVVVVLLYMTMWVSAVVETQAARDRPEPVTGGEHAEPAAPPPSPVKCITGSILPDVPKPA